MLKAMAQRVGAAAAVLFVVSLLTFAALHLLPGDPAVLVLGLEGTPEKVAALREAMGLNDPLPKQYASWLVGLVQGDWGMSRVYGIPVLDAIGGALPVTFELAAYAMLLALLVSVPLGVFAALRPGGPVDALARTLAQLASAAPGFWLAVLFMLFFAGTLGWFPVSGYTALRDDPLACIRSLTLAATVLAVGECGVLIRTVRSSVMTALGRDCMLSAEAKGLTRFRSIFVYAVRGALVAPLTVAGLQLAKLVGGTAVVESVFALPGLGRLLLTAVEQRDIELVQGIVVVVTIAVVLVSLATDLIIMAVQPSVRVTEECGRL